MSDSAVRVETDGDLHIVRLERDANLFDEVFVASFHDALDVIERDAPGAPVVTIGAGKFFSNGFDLDYLGSLDLDRIGDFVTRSCRLLGRILTLPAPTVAAINGHA